MKKAKACYADGGVVGHDGLTDAQRAKKNAALNSLGMGTAPAPAAQPVSQPAQVVPQTNPVQPNKGTITGIADMLGNRNKVIDKAAGYACGGKVKAHANGGKIQGAGTPTSDSIPAKIRETGEDIRVSNGERIVSKAQDNLLQLVAKGLGFDGLDSMLESGTGKPVGPTMKGGKRAARYGANGEWIPDTKDDKAPAGGQWATPSASVPAPSAPQNNAERDPMKISNPLLSFSNAVDNGRSAVGNVFADSAAANREGTDYATAHANRIAGDGQSAAPSPAQQQSPKPMPEFKSGDPFSPEKERFPIGAKSEFITGNNGAMPDSSGGGFVSGNRAYNVSDTSEQGIQRVTSKGTSPLYTNIKPETAVATLGNQMVGQPTAEAATGLARMANANKIRGEMIANMQEQGGPAGGVTILGVGADGMTDAERGNAEKTARWRMDDLLAKSNRGNQGAIAEAMRANSIASLEPARQQLAMRGQDIASQRDAERNNIAMRGQDINALGDRAKLSMLERNDQRQAEKFALDKRFSEGALADSETQRAARGKLSQALASGDPAAITKAHTEAVAAGLQFDREDKGMKPVEIADPTDKLGMRKILVQPNTDGTYTPMQARNQSSPQQEYQDAIKRAGSNKAMIDAINARARKNKVIE